MRRGLAACTTVVALAAGGCAVTKDYRPPAVDLPAQWSGTAGNAAPAAVADSPWWRTFGDPLLDALVDRALAANVDLQLAQARVREARARGGAAASLWPSFAATASYARERESENAPSPVLVRRDGEVETPGSTENLFQGGFDASWELDVFGGTRRGREAAQADLQSAWYDRGAMAVTLVAEVCKAYFDLRGAQQQSQLVRESVAAQKETVALLQDREQAGMATGLDVARVEGQLQRAGSQLPVLETGRKKALHRLALLLGQAPDALGEEPFSQGPLPDPPAEPPLGLPSDLLRQRPDIRSAERRVAAASARVGAATSDLYPKFFLSGKAGLASVAAEEFFNGSSAFWSVGPSISWPIFQGGRIKATIEVRDAQLQQALISYRRAILTGIEDVENALAEYRDDEARQEILARAVASQQQLLTFARERYAGGLSDFFEVLVARQGLFEAQSELLRCRISLLLDVVALYKALGGGWNLAAFQQGRS